MCDPVGMIGLAFSVGSAVMQYQAQQDVMNKQQQANNEWLSYQRMKARQSDANQEAARSKADVARGRTLDELNAKKQQEGQETEQTRLEGEFMPTVDAQTAQGQQSIGDQILGKAGGRIEQHYADALTSATRDARQRMQNLAAIASTTGSQFGLANRNNSLLGESQDTLKLQGDIRQGDLVAYGVSKQVEPIKYAINPAAGMYGGIASAAGGFASKVGAAAAGGSQST
jgi:hypothetical protein